MNAFGRDRSQNRSTPATAVTSSGPSQPHSRLPGIGGTSRSRTRARSTVGCSTGPAYGPRTPPILRRHTVAARPVGLKIAGQEGVREDARVVDEQVAGVLVLAGTPIGDPGDASPRLRA